MSEILLSICIPTYNRGDLLKVNLLEIINQANELKVNIEICISDNASNDNTDEIVRMLPKSDYIDIIYKKNEINIGPDLNYLKAIDISKGKYCWFMGSDDLISHNSLHKLIKTQLSSNSDIYICNRIDCNYSMQPFFYNKWSNINEKKEFDFRDETQFIKYLELSNSLGAIYSYLSSIIFKKSVWEKIDYDTQFTGTAYSHVYKLMKFRDFSSNVMYLPDYFVKCRHGNDHFMKDGIVKRFMLDIDGYLLLAEKLFKDEDSKVYNAFLGVMTREHPISKIILIKSKSNLNEWFPISKKLEVYGYNKLILDTIKWIPNLILIIIYKTISVLIKINNLFFNKTNL